MARKPNIKKILKENPQVDIQKLGQGLKLSKKLRSIGIMKRGYGLALPYSRRRAHVSPQPYTIYLKRS